jgi:hypothetical protein
MFGGINPRHAPAPWLPLPFLLSAPLAFAAGHLLLAMRATAVLGSFRATSTIAVTHLLILGGVVAAMLGALYQLAPVVFVADAPDGRLGLVQAALYTAGWPMMVCGFLTGKVILLATGGTCVVTAIVLFVITIGRVLRSATQWDTPGWYILAALTWLVATVTFGLLFALDWRFGWFPIPTHVLAIHVHFGGIGWLTFLLMGVSYRLVPMFAIAPAPTGKLARTNLLAMIVLLCALGIALALDAPRTIIASIAFGLAAGCGVYLWDMARIYRARRRRFDLTMAAMWGALAALGIAALMGALWSTGVPAHWFAATPWLLTYGYLAIAGWCALAICGQLTKIIPFLIWLHRYGPGMGRGPVPLLNDMLPWRAAAIAVASYAAGFAVTVVGLFTAHPGIVQVGSLLASAGALTLFGALLTVLLPHHRSTRRPEHQVARAASNRAVAGEGA